MGTNCARLVADLFLYCYERDYDIQADVIEAFNSTSKYIDIDDLLNIDNPYSVKEKVDFELFLARLVFYNPCRLYKSEIFVRVCIRVTYTQGVA